MTTATTSSDTIALIDWNWADHHLAQFAPAIAVIAISGTTKGDLFNLFPNIQAKVPAIPPRASV